MFSLIDGGRHDCSNPVKTLCTFCVVALFLYSSFNMFTLTQQVVLELWLKMSMRALVKNFDWRSPEDSYLKISGKVKRLEHKRRLQKEF